MDKFHIGIISHLRPRNVQKVQAITGENVTWYVGKGEERDYRLFGAKNVIESGKLCESRNAILDDAFKQNKIAVELSDDLSKLEFITDIELKTKVPVTLETALEYMLGELNKTDFKLAGVSPTPNAFFFHSEFSRNLFILGDFIMVKPCDERFDIKMALKEDYDYTVQHLKKYGGALRMNRILSTFSHRTNKGGAVEYRTPEKEQTVIKYLMEKHKGYFRLNPRRPNEILMNKRVVHNE